MSCSIVRNNNGTIREVLAPNGEPSTLFDQINEMVEGEPELAAQAVMWPRTSRFIEIYGDTIKNQKGESVLFEKDGVPVYAIGNQIINEKDIASFQELQEQLNEDSISPAPLFDVNDKEETKEERDQRKQENRFAIFVTDRYNRRRLLKTEQSKLIKERRASSSKSEQLRLAKLITEIDKKVKDLEEEIEFFQGKAKMSHFKYTADADLRYAESILSQTNPTITNLQQAEKIIKMYKVIGTFKPGREHPMLTQRELELANPNNGTKTMQDLAKTMQLYGDKADHLHIQLTNKYKRIIEAKIKETFGDGTKIDFDAFIKDIGLVESAVLDISEYGSVVLDALHAWNKKASFLAKEEAVKIFHKIEELLKGIRDAGLTEREAYEMMEQTISNTDGRRTGNLVSPFTAEFNEEFESRLEKAKYQTQTKKKGKDKAWWAFNKWTRDNVEIIDARRLFQKGPAERLKYTKYLFATYGKDVAVPAIAKAEQLWNEYETDVQVYKESLEKAGYTPVLIQSNLDRYRAENSPVYTAEMNDISMLRWAKNNKYTDQHVELTMRYTVGIPRMSNKDNADLGWYDEKYKRLQSIPAVKAFYDYTVKIIEEVNSFLPEEVAKDLRNNTLPTIYKNLIDKFSEQGMHMGLAPLLDSMKRSVRDDDLSQYDYNERDPETGEPINTIQLQYVRNNKKELANYVKNKELVWKNENPRSSFESDAIYYNKLEQLRREWRRDKLEEISQAKSFDIGKVLGAYALWGLGYKHKSRIEDSMRITKGLLYNQLEQQVNTAGNPVKDPFNNDKLGKEGLSHTRKALDHFMDVFYGFKIRARQGAIENEKFNEKFLTTDDKKRLEEIDETIEAVRNNPELTPEMREEELKRLEEERSKIGGTFVTSMLGKHLLKYFHLLGMGWNFTSAIVNLGFGYLASSIQAAGGQVYTEKEYNKALMIMLGSAGRNLTANHKHFGESKKVRSLIEKFDVLKSSKYEVISKAQSATLFKKWRDKTKWADFYNPQQRSEYFVQGADMVAVLLAQEVTLIDGTVTNLWDAVNEDGSYPDGMTAKFRVYDEESEKTKTPKYKTVTGTENILVEAKFRIDKVVKENHGNYDPESPVLIKRGFWGTAASMFRMWMFMGYQARVGKTRVDQQLGMKRKGRYITLLEFAGNFSEMDSGIGYATSRLKAMKYFLDKLTFGLTTRLGGAISFEQLGLSEVDAANMRRNMKELAWIVQIGAFTMIARGMKELDDDDNKMNESRWGTINTMLNIANRLETDLLFYSSPEQFRNIMNNILPVTGLYTDVVNWFDSFIDFFDDEKRNFDRGIHKGSNKLMVRTLNLFPGIKNIYRTKAFLTEEVKQGFGQ